MRANWSMSSVVRYFKKRVLASGLAPAMLIVSLSVDIYHWKQIISHDVHFDPMERSLTTQFILKARNYMKSNDPRHFEEETQGTTAGTSCRRVSLRPDYAITYKLQCNIGNSSNGPSTVPFSIPKPSSGGFREGSGGSLYFHGMIKSAKRPHTHLYTYKRPLSRNPRSTLPFFCTCNKREE